MARSPARHLYFLDDSEYVRLLSLFAHRLSQTQCVSSRLHACGCVPQIICATSSRTNPPVELYVTSAVSKNRCINIVLLQKNRGSRVEADQRS